MTGAVEGAVGQVTGTWVRTDTWEPGTHSRCQTPWVLGEQLGNGGEEKRAPDAQGAWVASQARRASLNRRLRTELQRLQEGQSPA